MILFYNDWNKYPSAIPDFNTTNKSFIQYSALLRDLGIKNNVFCLAILDQSLIGIDPHSPDLDLVTKSKISIECKNNPWYFFRECAKAPPISGNNVEMVTANRGNISLWWCFFNHILVVLQQPRQTGKTFSTDILQSLLLNVMCANTKINLLTRNDDLRRKHVIRLKEIMSKLPKYLQQRTKADLDNSEEISIKSLNNYFSTHVPQASAKAASGQGKGLTSPIFHIDEAPFQPNIHIALPSALGATGAAVESAKRNGEPYGTILTTTAGKLDEPEGQFVYNIILGAAIWTEKLLDCENEEELRHIVCKSSSGGEYRMSLTFNHRQLGYSDEWLKEKISSALAVGDDVKRDYLLEWTHGTASHPLGKELLKIINESVTNEEFLSIDKEYGYTTRWYVNERELEHILTNESVVMGLDTSDAIGNDDIGAYFIRLSTMETLGVGNYNETYIPTFAAWVANLLIKYPKLVLIPERRSTGSTIVDYLLISLTSAGIDPFKKIFNRVVQDTDEDPQRFRDLKSNTNKSSLALQHKKFFGFSTSGTGVTSRNNLYSSVILAAAKKAASKLYDRILINQISALKVKNGRVDHSEQGHDDLVIAWLLANWLIISGKNLDYYGIDSNLIYKGNSVNSSNEIQENLSDKQLFLREEVNRLLNEITSETNEMVLIKLEKELRMNYSQIELTAEENYSLDAILNNIKKEKRLKRIGMNNPNNKYSGNYNQDLQCVY